ncbi:response regulator transcription factor [Kushneria sp. AK178]
MDVTNTALIMVTKGSPQNELFLDYLRQQLGCHVQQLPTDEPPDLPEHLKQCRVVALLDDDHLEESVLREWTQQLGQYDEAIFTAFNMSDEDRAVSLMMRMPLHGIFYRGDSLELISKGIRKLFEGEMWLSRPLMERLLCAYWHRQHDEQLPLASLTPREQEILGLLDSGASNLDIADRLSISEHTVKSHLYHVFRKLKVRNRAQALNLLRQQPTAVVAAPRTRRDPA